MSILVVIAVCLLAIGAVTWVLIRKLAVPATVAQCDPSWVDGFSVEKYRPMLRLLSDRDHEFMVGQPGFRPEMWKRLRSERRKIFRAYLRNLIRDFHRLHLAGRMILVYSAQDRPELAALLLRQRIQFTWAVLQIQCRLTFHAIGVATVDVSPLIEALEAARLNIGQLTPTTGMSAA